MSSYTKASKPDALLGSKNIDVVPYPTYSSIPGYIHVYFIDGAKALSRPPAFPRVSLESRILVWPLGDWDGRTST